MPIKVGDIIPSIEMYENDPSTRTDLAVEGVKGKIIVMGVPGAFIPNVLKSQLAQFIKRFDDFRKKGVVDIFCVTVNDVFVTSAWCKSLGSQGKVRFLADPKAQFTKMIGMDEHVANLGGRRSRRYSMVVDAGLVTQLLTDGGTMETNVTSSIPESLRI